MKRYEKSTKLIKEYRKLKESKKRDFINQLEEYLINEFNLR